MIKGIVADLDHMPFKGEPSIGGQNHEDPAGTDDAAKFGEGSLLISDVLEYFVHPHAVKVVVGERQLLGNCDLKGDKGQPLLGEFDSFGVRIDAEHLVRAC